MSTVSYVSNGIVRLTSNYEYEQSKLESKLSQYLDKDDAREATIMIKVGLVAAPLFAASGLLLAASIISLPLVPLAVGLGVAALIVAIIAVAAAIITNRNVKERDRGDPTPVEPYRSPEQRLRDTQAERRQVLADRGMSPLAIAGMMELNSQAYGAPYDWGQ